MLDPPSQALLDRLFENQICTPRDLRRCRKRVQRLTRDLPAFDSVWIDALLQERRLTPFQARLLDASPPGQIVVGPCILLDRLGGGQRSETFLARHKTSRQVCVLKLIAPRDGFSVEEFSSFERVVANIVELNHPCIVGPQVCDRLGARIVVVSRHVAGPHLAELLVRRGRFPDEIVWEIGRQLLDGLAALHACGQMHGDIRTHNVRLVDSGLAVLVDAGIRPVLERDLTIHTAAAPERFDGIAPELIGTGRSHAPTTDFYALGCLLWQLLAGRPPFPGGDPLAKIAAHQTQTVEDVREWAPDTSPQLAQAIACITDPDPTKRPQSARDAVAIWGRPSRMARSKVSRFVAGFRGPVRTTREGRSAGTISRWAPVFVLVFLLSGLATFLSDQGARNVVLEMVQGLAPSLKRDTVQKNAPHDETTTPDTATNVTPQQKYLALPEPQSGVIELSSAGPYGVRQISAVGPLVVRGTANVPAEIVVENAPLVISAEAVRLENIRLRYAGANENSSAPGSLALVQADRLDVVGCEFQTHELSTTPAPVTPAARLAAKPIGVAWRNLGTQPGGTVRLQDTRFRGASTALHLASAPQRLLAQNCVRLGPGTMFVLSKNPHAGRPLTVQLTSVTCRESGPLWNWRLPDHSRRTGSVRIEAANCVFHAVDAHTPLLEFLGDAVRDDYSSLVAMHAVDTIMRPQTPVAAWLHRQTGNTTPLADDKLTFEGVFAVPFTFQGAVTDNPADSELSEIGASISLRSEQLPGFHAR
mgnify:CR=1 FL=1